jgi:hypothetical protein
MANARAAPVDAPTKAGGSATIAIPVATATAAGKARARVSRASPARAFVKSARVP